MSKFRSPLIFVFLIFAVFLASLVSVCSGSVHIPPLRVFQILFLHGTHSLQESNIVLQIRLPRVIMAFLLGGGLSLSGFLLQTYFQNPIAGPFVLGISSGAKMFVAMTMIFFLQRGISVGSAALVTSSFAGAIFSTLFILLISKKVHHIGSLLVAGIMIGYITSALTDFFVTFAQDADIVNLHNWSKGSFAGFSLSDCAVSGVIILLCVIFVFLLAKPISAYQLGESYARTMGVNTKLFRPLLILLSSVLSACVTAFAGPVSFVGIAVPFLIKQLFQTSKPLTVIPASFLGGALFCLVCDLIARSVFAPLELSISTVTSIFGAPVVIFMLISRRKGK
ncbi:iron ABC transporter permease [uncultured Treponema sp.]|uniref:FecCD family ABC transporter permease n=1 Tax=uncultured Treponema sp. TaxID=162155 RepID=UPI0025D2B2D5|nr:iron ABC transporter permease [uncultured Treponema sp.]